MRETDAYYTRVGMMQIPLRCPRGHTAWLRFRNGQEPVLGTLRTCASCHLDGHPESRFSVVGPAEPHSIPPFGTAYGAERKVRADGR